jgi:two-component system nitrogen regulation response regulator NtrX
MGSTTLAEARTLFERDYLLQKLRDNEWNISRTAEEVGLARESLSRKLRSLSIDPARERNGA